MERRISVVARLPLELKQAIEQSARANRRSVVREIQTMLERCVATVPNVEEAPLAEQQQ
jgi:hypothetical protein